MYTVTSNVMNSTTSAAPQANKIPIAFSPARVRQVFDPKGLNEAINEALRPHKEIVTRYNACKQALEKRIAIVKITHGADGSLLEKPIVEEKILTPEQVLEREKELNELIAKPNPTTASKYEAASAMVNLLSREKIRFANAAAPALAVVCEEIVKELLTGAVSVVCASSMKIVYPKHIFQSNAATKFHKLYNILEVYSSRKNTFDAEQQAKRAQKEFEASLALAKKEWSKEKNLPVEKKREVAQKNPKVKQEKANTAEIITPATGVVSFKVYVGHVINAFKQDEAHKTVRFSDDIRNFLSEIILEFVLRISTKVNIDIISRKNKTVTPAVVMRAVECLLVEGFTARTEICVVDEMKPDPTLVKPGMTDEQRDALPKVPVKVVNKKITYEGSNYPDIHCKVVSALVAAGHDRKNFGL